MNIFESWQVMWMKVSFSDRTVGGKSDKAGWEPLHYATKLKVCVMSSSVWRMYSIFLEDQLPSGFPTIDMGPQLKVVERSRTATMLCAASGNPDPEITWFKDFLPVNTSNNNGRIKQLRSGNQCFFHSFPLNLRFYLYLKVFLPPTLLWSLFRCPLPRFLPQPMFLFSVPIKLLFFLPSFTPFLIAVAHSSCHGYWLCLSLLLYELTLCAVANSSRP